MEAWDGMMGRQDLRSKTGKAEGLALFGWRNKFRFVLRFLFLQVFVFTSPGSRKKERKKE